MAGVVDTLRSAIRAAVGLPDDPGSPPDLMRLGLYRARVDKCASDGSTLDVTPEDKRISPEKNVKFCVPIAGAVIVMQTGAIVHLGWEGGDPGKPYCAPMFDLGASLTSLAIGSSPDNVVTKTDIDNIKTTISGAAVVAQDGGAAFKANILSAWPASVGSQAVKVQR